MIWCFFSQDFRKGMNLYLTRHQYKNTYTEDLWAALEEASNKPVAAVMSTWTKQMGFPVVRVTVSQKEDSAVLTLSQERFTAGGNSQGTWHAFPWNFGRPNRLGKLGNRVKCLIWKILNRNVPGKEEIIPRLYAFLLTKHLYSVFCLQAQLKFWYSSKFFLIYFICY